MADKKLQKAPVSEIFFSYQGEGIYLGQPQIFVRFMGCNINCDYCDTLWNNSPNRSKFLSVNKVFQKIRSLSKRNNSKVVSITGGEPLIYTDFLIELLPMIKKAGLEVYLETNGTLHEHYRRIAKWVDTTAMDIKVPSSCKKAFWKEHKQFLREARVKTLRQTKERIFVKMVLTKRTTTQEVRKAVELVKRESGKIHFVFQPATAVRRCGTAESHKIYQWYMLAGRKLGSVSVLPQMHRFWDIK